MIYLDNNASAAPDPAVLEAVTRSLRDLIANPSSHHVLGQRAARAVEDAREQVACLVGCRSRMLTFTSGATEASSLAIRGIWAGSRSADSGRDRVVVASTEHPAVLESAASLRRCGACVAIAPVDARGVIDLDALSELVDERTLLVSVMAANNETGTLTPLAEVVHIAKCVGAYVHTDATQLIGRLPFNMPEVGVDLLSLSGHKMYGPKGVGALVADGDVPLSPQIFGGGHERGLRSGTLNTPGIAGLGVAARLASTRFDEAESISRLRDKLHQGLAERLTGVSLNGHPTSRLPNTVNLRFAGADADAIMASLRRVVCSSGSACSSAVPEPSHVLLAMGLDRDAASECLRFSLSRTTTVNEIEEAIEDVLQSVTYVREMSAVGAGV